MIGRVALHLGVAAQDRREIQFLADQIADQMGGMASRDEVSNRRRQKPNFISLSGAKHFSHAT